MVSSYYAGHEAHAYLMVMSEDGRWSESVYCGSIRQGETSGSSLASPSSLTSISSLASEASSAGGAGDQGVEKEKRRR